MPCPSVPGHRSGAICGALALILSSSLSAQQPGAPADSSGRRLDTVRVLGRVDDLVGVAASASEGRVDASYLRRRPMTREGEVLEAVPGVIVTQHSGEGKANQLFVRGFNLDHGTDFSTRIEGMPVNMPTHAHGQGYTDLNFLIPELVDGVEYRLGVHHAETGDFGSAGGADIRLVRTLDRPFLAIARGANGFGRLVGGAAADVGAGRVLVGAELKSYDGPWARAGALRKRSALARYSTSRGASRFSILAMAYENGWNANDQIALRAVDAGVVTRFGQIDSTDRGAARRYSLAASLQRVGARAVDDVMLFAIRSDLRLFSNFTYFLDDPIRGDQFAQTERRTVVGVNAIRTASGIVRSTDHRLRLGLQSRADIVGGLGLARTERTVPVSIVRDDRVRQGAAGVFAEVESRWTTHFRSVLGLRADGVAYDVESDRVANAGRGRAGILSPKASIAFAPTSRQELYLSGGLGFHSNDVRGATIRVDPATGEPTAPVRPLVRSRGGEIGFRSVSGERLRTSIALWMLDLDSELVFAGDVGTTEPSPASARRGATVSGYLHAAPRMTLDADLSLARARYRGVPPDESHVPGALERVFGAGVSWTPRPSGAARHADGVFSALRVRHFGRYPLTESGTMRARASTLLNADVGFQRGATRVSANVLNLLDGSDHDIEYVYASRLRGEPAGGVTGVHAHPVEPRQVRILVERRF